jgi:hypothetical protein
MTSGMAAMMAQRFDDLHGRVLVYENAHSGSL